MGMMSHVEVVESVDKTALDIPVESVGLFDPQGTIDAPSSPSYAVLDRGSINLATLRNRLRGVSIQIAEQSFASNNRAIPAGSFIVDGAAYQKLKAAVVPLGLTAIGLPDKPSVRSHEAALPRVAIYSTWGSTQNVGWVRYAFDQSETPYQLIFKEQVRKGNLRAKYDVIIIPSQGRTAKDVVYDIPVYGQPLPYTKTARYRFSGDYGSSPDIRGGMGLVGLEEMRKFASEGGMLITLGESSAVPADFGLTPDISVKRPSAAFYAPGPIVTANVLNGSSPIFYGYTDRSISVRWASTALLSVPLRDKRNVLMEFPGGEKSVLSGFMNGADEIKDRPAIVLSPLDSGQVLMFATNPIYRWQNFGEFRMLYNALFNYKNLRISLDEPAAATDSAKAAHGE
jgi:hypothetical protein